MADADFCLVIAFEDDSRDRFALVRHVVRGWELPGGRIEPGETPQAAAEREFLEETGHRLLRARLLLAQRRGEAQAWVFEGVRGPTATPGGAAPLGLRFVRRLGEAQPLAFPDDPYEEMEAALGRRLR